MAGDIEHLLWFDEVNVQDVSPYRISAWLADRPCNIKGRKDCVWPIQEMAELLGGTIEPLSSNMRKQNVGKGADIIKLSQYRNKPNQGL